MYQETARFARRDTRTRGKNSPQGESSASLESTFGRKTPLSTNRTNPHAEKTFLPPARPSPDPSGRRREASSSWSVGGNSPRYESFTSLKSWIPQKKNPGHTGVFCLSESPPLFQQHHGSCLKFIPGVQLVTVRAPGKPRA